MFHSKMYQVSAHLEFSFEKHCVISEALVKPAFEGDIKGQKVEWGNEFRMSSRVSGNPKPKVKWYKDGVEVKDGENGVKLASDDVIGGQFSKQNKEGR